MIVSLLRNNRGEPMEATLMQLATQIAQQQAYLQWQLWVSAAVLAVVCIFVAGYLRNYSSKVADIKAQTDKLPEIQHILAETTRTTEQIKAEVGQKDWRERERLVLMRNKLEATLAAAFELNEAGERLRNTMTQDTPVDEVEAADSRLQVLTTLYFPELRPFAAVLKVLSLKMAHSARSMNLAFGLYKAHYAVDQNSAETRQAHQALTDTQAKHNAEYPETYKQFLKAMSAFTDQAAAEMPKYAP